MEKEKSCGGVIYFASGNRKLFLIEKMQMGHCSICKGHVEGNETNLETALREIKEETNLEVILKPGFEHMITYSPKKDVIKDVYFYLFETKSMNVIPQEIEVNTIMFLDYESAYKTLTFDSDKETLKLANEFIIKNNL